MTDSLDLQVTISENEYRELKEIERKYQQVKRIEDNIKRRIAELSQTEGVHAYQLKLMLEELLK